jgi:hypothetical protein
MTIRVDSGFRELTGETAREECPSVCSRVFEWTTNYGRGKARRFSIPFWCIDSGDGRPREFWMEPVMRGLETGDQGSFLSRACSVGHEILNELEPQSKDVARKYEIATALFRHRNAGHVAVGRNFGRALDFFEVGAGSQMTALPPGLCSESSVGTLHTSALARRHLIDSIRAGSEGASPRVRAKLEAAGVYYSQGAGAKKPRLSPILAVQAFMEHMIESSPPQLCSPSGADLPGVVALNSLSERTWLDRLWVDGTWDRSEPWDVNRALTIVGSALIAGGEPADFSNTVSANAAADREKAGRVLGKAVRSKKKPSEFDKWLTNVREHGFLQLLGKTSAKGQDRAEYAARASAAYRYHLWISYQLMSRNYGALALLMYLHFTTSTEISPSAYERWLFRQAHFPQLYLAGLPLCFFGRSQQRWIAKAVRERWKQPELPVEDYDFITELLGLFGTFVTERRRADRTTYVSKREKLSAFTEDEMPTDRPPSKEGIASLSLMADGAPRLTSLNCPKCNQRLSPSECLGQISKTDLLVALFCSECDTTDHYLLNPSSFSIPPSVS